MMTWRCSRFKSPRELASAWAPYLVGVLSVALAVLLTLALRLFQTGSVFLLFCAAVTVTAWLGGTVPGLLAAVLGAVASAELVLTPEDRLLGNAESIWIRLCLFLVVAALTRCVHRTVYTARRQAAELAQAREELQLRERRLVHLEAEKERFYREVIRCVTRDKFYLATAEEIPLEGQVAIDVSLGTMGDLASLRHQVQTLAEGADMKPEDVQDLVLALGEASANAIRHARAGRCRVSVADHRVIVRVSDEGAGLRPEHLAASILLPGFSSKASLGMGYTIMLAMADRIWLATGPQGTVLQLEKWIDAGDRVDLGLPAAWPRL